MASSKYDRWAEFLCARGEAPYRYRQILHALFELRQQRFADIQALPVSLRNALEAEFGPGLVGITPIAETGGTQAHKVLFDLGDGERVEAVRLTYRGDWRSICISSQCGCGLGCSFCATGAIGLRRNLTADEITDQVLHFRQQGDTFGSISFMGMGEPLANPETFAALRILTDRRLFALSPRRLTISTVGVIPALERLAGEHPQVRLVFSLHSPFADQRSELVPLNRRYPLDDVMPALDRHVRKTGRQVSIAYVLIEGVNDSLQHARGVVRLLRRPLPLYHVNLIRYHRAFGIPAICHAPDRTAVASFLSCLTSAGIRTTLRPSFGAEIDSACGQLFGRYARIKEHTAP